MFYFSVLEFVHNLFRIHTPDRNAVCLCLCVLVWMHVRSMQIYLFTRLCGGGGGGGGTIFMCMQQKRLQKIHMHLINLDDHTPIAWKQTNTNKNNKIPVRFLNGAVSQMNNRTPVVHVIPRRHPVTVRWFTLNVCLEFVL